MSISYIISPNKEMIDTFLGDSSKWEACIEEYLTYVYDTTTGLIQEITMNLLKRAGTDMEAILKSAVSSGIRSISELGMDALKLCVTAYKSLLTPEESDNILKAARRNVIEPKFERNRTLAPITSGTIPDDDKVAEDRKKTDPEYIKSLKEKPQEDVIDGLLENDFCINIDAIIDHATLYAIDVKYGKRGAHTTVF